MKLLLNSLLTLFLLSASWAHSQEKIDKRLLIRYSESELTQMLENNPEEYKILTYALDNGMYIGNYSKEKGSALTEIDRPSKNQTYIDLNFEISDQNQYYKIKGEDKVLVVKSKNVLMNELKIK
jgi:hypothetical protein